MDEVNPNSVHNLNQQRLKSYLVQSVGIGTHNDQLTVKQFNIGQSNPTYYVKLGNRELVLRKRPPGKLLRGAHQVDREYRVMKAVYSKGFPVPQMIDYCLDRNVVGTDFYVMEFMPGRVVYINMNGVEPHDRRECVKNSVKTLSQLHQIDPVELGLQDFGKTSDYCRRVLNTWTKQYYASIAEPVPEMKNLISWLQKKLPLISDESCIIHGDYSFNNIMMHASKNTVLAVLDWELSTIGHPLMDFAYFCMIFHAPPEFFIMQQVTKDALDQLFKSIPTEDELVRYYCKLRGIPYPIPNWNFFIVLNFFKLAGILQGVYSRHLQGNASSPFAYISGSVVLPLIKAALKLTESEMNPLATMDLSLSLKGQKVLKEVKAFVQEHVEPNEQAYFSYLKNAKDPFCVVPLMENLKAKAKAVGLWNLFLPAVSGLSNVDYAHIAEILGRSPISSEVFNCSAPDTGNMEVLHMYGDDFQKKTWLQPLLDGKIRSAFCMTEPQVASSDATNMELTIKRDGDCYLVNGRKWWSSGAADPRCTFGIVMGRTGQSGAPKHGSHSMIIVPFDTPGVTRVRNLTVFGYNDAPHGHSEMRFDNVRVPARNLILGEGRGFEIAQGRLGPGRIHHCMRSIGLAERSMELTMKRGAERRPFGKRILEHQVTQHQLAECRIAIDQCRLLTLNAANMIDHHGAKKAMKEIAMIKVAGPRMLCDVIDRGIQIHGGAGVSDDFPLASWYAGARSLRLADGPDEVHLSSIAKLEIRDQLRKAKL